MYDNDDSISVASEESYDSQWETYSAYDDEDGQYMILSNGPQVQIINGQQFDLSAEFPNLGAEDNPTKEILESENRETNEDTGGYSYDYFGSTTVDTDLSGSTCNYYDYEGNTSSAEDKLSSYYTQVDPLFNDLAVCRESCCTNSLFSLKQKRRFLTLQQRMNLKRSGNFVYLWKRSSCLSQNSIAEGNNYSKCEDSVVAFCFEYNLHSSTSSFVTTSCTTYILIVFPILSQPTTQSIILMKSCRILIVNTGPCRKLNLFTL
jgi:hypothetical protein